MEDLAAEIAKAHKASGEIMRVLYRHHDMETQEGCNMVFNILLCCMTRLMVQHLPVSDHKKMVSSIMDYFRDVEKVLQE